MSQEHNSKPIKRVAVKIVDKHELEYYPDKSEGSILSTDGRDTFWCNEEPKVGDYVIYMNDIAIFLESEKCLTNTSQ